VVKNRWTTNENITIIILLAAVLDVLLP
jgi:hypothetical protein